MFYYNYVMFVLFTIIFQKNGENMVSINNFISLALMVLSATLIAFAFFAMKYLVMIYGIYLSMFISFIGSSILMWWIVSISSFTKIIPSGWRSIFARVIFSFLAQIFLFISLSKESLLITILLFNTSPLYIPIIHFIFFKHFTCILISFLGIYLILGNGSGSLK